MTNTANQSIKPFIDSLNKLASSQTDLLKSFKIWTALKDPASIGTYKVFHDHDNIWEREAFVVGKTLVLVSNLAKSEFWDVQLKSIEDPKTRGLINYVTVDTIQDVKDVCERYSINSVKLFAPLYVENLADLPITEIVRGEIKDSPITRPFKESFAEYLQNHRANLEDYDVDGWICDGDWSLIDAPIRASIMHFIDTDKCPGLLVAPLKKGSTKSAHKNAYDNNGGASAINVLVRQFISRELAIQGLIEDKSDHQAEDTQTGRDAAFLYASERGRTFISRKTGIEPAFNNQNSVSALICYCIDQCLMHMPINYKLVGGWYRYQRTCKVRAIA